MPRSSSWLSEGSCQFALAPGLSLTGGSLLTGGDREVDYRGIALSAVKRLSGRSMLYGFLNWAETEWRIPESFRAFEDPTDSHMAVVPDNDGDEAVETHVSFPGVFLNSPQAADFVFETLSPRVWRLGLRVAWR